MFFVSCDDDKSQLIIKDLDKWQYSREDEKIWHNIYIPGSVQNALVRDTVFKPLFLRGFFLKQRYADSLDWNFKSEFFVSNEILKHKKIYLVFERIDTYAEVYLNDSLLFKANNYFVKYQIDVKKLLKTGKNNLLVKIQSPFNAIKQIKKKIFLPYGGLEYIRKPFYHFDTSKAIVYTPIGLGRVYLKMWDNAIITNQWFKTVNLDTINRLAQMQADITINSAEEFNGKIQISYKHKILIRKNVSLKQGINHLKLMFPIKNVKLWWTYDLGTPFLYKLKTELFKEKQVIDVKEVNIGIRKIQIDTTGNIFKLKINGKPLFIKAAKHLPLSLFAEKVDNNAYKDYLFLIKKAGINTLYCSRDGYYENDQFYKLCDKYGILVWQDFMLPYDILPVHYNLISNISKEILYQVKRLRNHPSIAFWSASNNLPRTWVKYRQHYKSKDSVYIFSVFNQLIIKKISNIVKQNDQRIYFPTMKFYSLVVIHDKYPAFPIPITLYSSITRDGFNYHNPILQYYIKPYFPIDTILSHIKYISEIPSNAENLIYLTQLLTYKYYKKRIERFLSNRFFTGIIIDNFKDYTPTISFSAIDFKDYVKGKYFAISKTFRPLIAKISFKNNWININVVSSDKNKIQADIYFKLYDFHGKTLWRKNYPNTDLMGARTPNIFRFNIQNVIKQHSLNNIVFKVEIYKNQELAYEDYYFFVKNKDLDIQPPNITIKTLKIEDGQILEFSTDYLAKDVFLYTPTEGVFSDNFITIIPGESKKVYFYSQKNATFKTLYLIDYSQRLNPLMFNKPYR